MTVWKALDEWHCGDKSVAENFVERVGYVDDLLSRLRDADGKVRAEGEAMALLFSNVHLGHQNHLPVLSLANQIAEIAVNLPRSKDSLILPLTFRRNLINYRQIHNLEKTLFCPTLVKLLSTAVDGPEEFIELSERILIS